MTLGEFGTLAGGVVTDADPNTMFAGFALDSRTAQPGQLFIAIRGKRSDGHEFVADALARGAVAALVERPVNGPHILVPTLVTSLARFASAQRAGFEGPVIGITGSNGKTATKEFTTAACSPLGDVLKSGGNFNTEYTAPLVWADLRPSTRVAVVEMGMRGLGQIAHLCSFVRPTIGVVTMIGTAHIEMVGSRDGIAQAKGELLDALPSNGTAVLNADDDYTPILSKRARCAVRTFGFSPDSECRILGYRALGWDRCVTFGRLDGLAFEAELPTVGRHQALNAAAAILAAHLVGVGVEESARALANAALPPLRMEVRQVSGATVLVDTYNASPDSTVAAIRTMCELPAPARRLAVIGEMRELGAFAETGHRQVGRALGEAALDGVLLFGDLTDYVESEAVRAGLDPARIRRAESLDDIRKFLHSLGEGDLVLMKGSRALEMESALPPTEAVPS